MSSTLFKAEKISVPQYFVQINPISSFLIANTSLTEADLLEVEKKDRKKTYDLTTREKIAPKALEEKEFIELARILFKQLSKEKSPELKKNTRVERLTQNMRNNRFSFTLDSDPQINIDHIINDNLYVDDSNRRNYLLGELYLDLLNPQEGRNYFEKITSEELRTSGLLILACFEKNFNPFLILLKKAFPESYLPKTYGRYVLSFLIGNENSFRYEIDESGQRNVTFAYSTGIIKIQRMDNFSSFISDNRLSPDGRIGLWTSPGKKEKQYTISNLIQLDFKQVLGWQDLKSKFFSN